MIEKYMQILEKNAFNIAAFSILGLLFITKPSTLVPTLLLLVCSMTLVFSSQLRKHAKDVWLRSEFKWIPRVIFFWFVTLLVLRLIHGGEQKAYFPENALRMLMATSLLALPVFPHSKKWFVVGVLIAGFAAALWSICNWPSDVYHRVMATTNNPIHFGNLSALVMILAGTMALIVKRINCKMRALLVMAALGGLLGALASMSRSSLIVVLCWGYVTAVIYKAQTRRWVITGLLLLMLVASALVGTSEKALSALRITEAQENIQMINSGDYHSSLGARVAMWKTAWVVFKDQPLFGIGQGNFPSEFALRMKNGDVPESHVFGQPHSDILHSLSSGGLLRLSAYLLIIGVPFLFFYKQFILAKQQRSCQIWPPLLGMQIVTTYFLTGLTNSNFDLQIYSTTYAILVCVLAKLTVFEINEVVRSKPSMPADQCY